MACDRHGYTNSTFCPACDLESQNAEPLSPEDLIEGQKVAEAMAERFPNEINSHSGRLFALLKIEVATAVRDLRRTPRLVRKPRRPFDFEDEQ
jgi:hypothetical protein